MNTTLVALKNAMDKADAACQRITAGTKARARAERLAWDAFVAFRDAGGLSAMLAEAGPGYWRNAR